MKKAQGSLEYLIIVAAVLAIAAVVVLFLSGAFKGTNTGTTACKNAASQCAISLQTTTGYSCTNSCVSACTGTNNLDVMSGDAITVATCTDATNNTAKGCGYCVVGASQLIG